MKEVSAASLRFMTRRERVRYSVLVLTRILTSILDLLGVLAIGYLATSIALFVTSGSDPSRTFQISGLAIPAANIQSFPLTVAVILMLFLIKAAGSIQLTKVTAVLLAEIESRAARVIAENVLGDQLGEFKTLTREELLFATSIGASSAFTGTLNNIATIFSEGFLFLVLIATFFVVDPISTFGVLIYFGVVALFIHFTTGKKLAESSQAILQNSIFANVQLNDVSNAFRELTVLGAKNLFFEKFETARLNSAKNIGRQLYLTNMPRYIVETAVLVGVLAFGGIKLLAGDLASAVTTLGIFFTGSMRIMAALLPLQAALVSIRGNIPQAKTAQNFMHSRKLKKIVHHEPESALVQIDFPLAVSVSDVDFNYGKTDKAALRDLTFEVPAGSIVAFIGKSGAGKSTIADLLMGLIKPKSGIVRVGDYEPTELINAIPGAIAYVPQNPGQISGTIAENILVGRARGSRFGLVLQETGLDAILSDLPHGAETALGQNNSLSGGQMQRLGLARAIYSNPKLLLVDEGTSALDATSEKQLMDSILSLRGKCTVILIAHRLNTVQMADTIFLVENGTIVDSGNFQDISRRNPSVAEAVELMAFDNKPVKPSKNED